MLFPVLATSFLMNESTFKERLLGLTSELNQTSQVIFKGLKVIHKKLQERDPLTRLVLAVLIVASITISQLPLIHWTFSAALLIGASFAFYKYLLEPSIIKLMKLSHEDEAQAAERELIDDEFARQDREVAAGFRNLSDSRYDVDRDTPTEFVCPITNTIIRQPVIIMEGTQPQAYELVALERWYFSSPHRNSPITRMPLPHPSTYQIDLELRRRITRYVLDRESVQRAIQGQE